MFLAFKGGGREWPGINPQSIGNNKQTETVKGGPERGGRGQIIVVRISAILSGFLDGTTPYRAGFGPMEIRYGSKCDIKKDYIIALQ